MIFGGAVGTAAADTVVATIAVDNYPSALAITPDGAHAYVVNITGDTVSAIDIDPESPTVNTVTATIPVGESPTWVAITPDGSRAYVTNQWGHSVSVIDTDPTSPTLNTVTTTIPVIDNPLGIAVAPDGRHAYVANYKVNWGGNTVSAIDIDPTSPTLNTVTTIPVGWGPSMVAVTPDSSHVYVTNNADHTVSVIDADPTSPTVNTVTSTISVGGNPGMVAVTPDGSRAYVANQATVSIIDTDPTSPTVNTVTSTIPVGASPHAVAITPDGSHAYVTNTWDRSVSVIRIEQAATVTGNPPAGVLGQPYGTYAFTVAGRPGPVTVTTTGTLPDGLILTDSGVLSGIPTKAGSFTFTVTASNSVGDSDPLSVTVEVTDTTPPTSTGSLSVLGPIFGS